MSAIKLNLLKLTVLSRRSEPNLQYRREVAIQTEAVLEGVSERGMNKTGKKATGIARIKGDVWEIEGMDAGP